MHPKSPAAPGGPHTPCEQSDASSGPEVQDTRSCTGKHGNMEGRGSVQHRIFQNEGPGRILRLKADAVRKRLRARLQQTREEPWGRRLGQEEGRPWRDTQIPWHGLCSLAQEAHAGLLLG